MRIKLVMRSNWGLDGQDGQHQDDGQCWWKLTLPIVLVLLWLAIGAQTPLVRAQQDLPTDEGQGAPSTSTAVTAESVQVRRVKVNFFINSIHHIDDEKGSYVVDFWLDLFWRDPALEGKTVSEVDPAQLWDPFVTTLNANDLTVLYRSYTDSFEPDTNVYLSQRLVGTFTNNFDLHRFPFDRQTLVMTLESNEYSSNYLLFDFMGADQAIIYSENPFTFPLPTGKYLSAEFDPGEWTLTTANVVQQIHVFPYDKSTWAQFRIELQVERQARPYVIKIMLVFLLIMVLGATVFAMTVAELRYRLLTLFILLLTAVTFNFTRLQASPRVPYLTILDLQALLSYLVLGVAIGAVVFVALQHRSGKTTGATRLNQGAVLVYGLLVLAINLGLIWYGTRG